MLNNEYYNEIYKKSIINNGEYSNDPKKSIYYKIWKELVLLIKNERILDIGCGVGQVAKLLIENKKNYQLGIDFSEYAIEVAKKIDNNLFEVFDINKLEEIDIDYDLSICLEVLEHIDGDIELINKLKKDSIFIFSVPNFLINSHVRCFNNKQEIISRYIMLDIKSIQYFKLSKTKGIFLCYSTKK